MIQPIGMTSLADFLTNAEQLVDRLKQSKDPLLLTVNGKAKLVVQDAEAYQAMVGELERSRFIQAVQMGLKEAQRGESRPADEVFAEMQAKYGL